MNKGIIDFTKNGKCSRCGGCCSNFLPLTEDEIKRLKELASKPTTEGQIKVTEAGDFIMTCPFLIMNNDDCGTYCSIYEDRPLICKSFICNKGSKDYEDLPKDVVITDIMKDICNYDYQELAGITYEEAFLGHIKSCLNALKK